MSLRHPLHPKRRNKRYQTISAQSVEPRQPVDFGWTGAPQRGQDFSFRLIIRPQS